MEAHELAFGQVMFETLAGLQVQCPGGSWTSGPQHQKVVWAGEADLGVSGHASPEASHSGRVFSVRKPREEGREPRNTVKVMQLEEVGCAEGRGLGMS